jgi:hypothetical protein
MPMTEQEFEQMRRSKEEHIREMWRRRRRIQRAIRLGEHLPDGLTEYEAVAELRRPLPKLPKKEK